MKKIINGKVYDTEKAKYLGCVSAKKRDRDTEYWEEELYLKRTGEYFIYGRGGALTKYAEPRENSNWGSGSRIMPVTYDEATKWAEENLSTDEYISIFGNPDAADDSAELLTISLPASLIRRIRTEAQQSGMTISGLVASRFGA